MHSKQSSSRAISSAPEVTSANAGEAAQVGGEEHGLRRFCTRRWHPCRHHPVRRIVAEIGGQQAMADGTDGGALTVSAKTGKSLSRWRFDLAIAARLVRRQRTDEP